MDAKQLLGSHLSSPCAFLETTSFDKENKTSFLFRDFKKIITFNSGDNLDLFFEQIEDFLQKGFWVCGYFSYEFGYFLDPALSFLREKYKFPLAWLGISKNPIIINRELKPSNSKLEGSSYSIKKIKPNISLGAYSSQILKIKKYIEQGLTYQVNFTLKIKFDFSGDILDFYLNLRRAQATAYSALINTGESFILSLSPELFFRREREKIITRPMKGTFARGLTLSEDRENWELFKENKKIKAENLMIVDLLRNDLGRVCRKVWVPKLFNIEKHKTLYQMTSDIKGRLKKEASIKDIFSSLFPSGSVTGAPKIKTMEIIKSLEKEPRVLYTGAIGYISPFKKACFNVAIRTAHIKNGRGEMGIGGGIVYDSLAKSEYDEALLKAKFLIERLPDFSLIESILWQEKKGYFLLGAHLKRLMQSCEYFSIPLDFKKIKNELKAFARNLRKGKFKVRVLVGQTGKIIIDKQALNGLFCPVRVKISPQRINPNNVFLYHKTTQRDLYDREKEKANKEGFFEVIFLNENEEVTEGTITNIFVSKKNRLYTPALKSGLLPGVLREHLLKKGRVEERVIYLKDILNADKVFIGNSVGGLLEAKIYD